MLCTRCGERDAETLFHAENRSHIQTFLDGQRRMHAAAAAHPASESLRPLLDALVTEAMRDPPDVATTRERMTALLQFLASPEQLLARLQIERNPSR